MHRYIRTPSRNEFDGTARVTGISLCSCRLSPLREKNSLLLRIGPPIDAPMMSLSIFGGVLPARTRAAPVSGSISLLDVSVRRKSSRPAVEAFVPLRVTSETCGH